MVPEQNEQGVKVSALEEESAALLRATRAIAYSTAGVALLIGLRSLSIGNAQHAWILFLFAGVVSASALNYDRSGNAETFKIQFVGLAALMLIYLISTGGENGSGALWIYLLPPFSFYLLGSVRGKWLMIGMIIIIFLIFMLEDTPLVSADYQTDFKIRYLATLIFATVFSYVLDTSRRRAQAELLGLANRYELAARTDELTGLPNRRYMQARLEREHSRYKRHGHHFSVILFDLDHFKRVNDSYGHDAGDHTLKEFSRLLEKACRHEDLPARWGGEEFIMLLPQTTLLQAITLADRVRALVQDTEILFKSSHIHLSVSCGVASITQAKELPHMLRQADVNLYQAKLKGRNIVVPLVVRNGDS